MCSGDKVVSKTWFRFRDAYCLTRNAVRTARRKELQGEGDPKAVPLSSSRDSEERNGGNDCPRGISPGMANRHLTGNRFQIMHLMAPNSACSTIFLIEEDGTTIPPIAHAKMFGVILYLPSHSQSISKVG